MQMRHSYAADLPFKISCKLARQAETTRNYQKQVLVMIKHCLGNSQNNSIPEQRVYLHDFSLQNRHQSLRVQPAQAYIIHSQREIEELFLTLKKSPFSLTQSIKVHRRALVFLPCLIPCHRSVKPARESCNRLTI